MKISLLILTLLAFLLPAAAQAQETPETKEIALNDSLSVRLRQITREEYETRWQASAHLQHKPYKAVTDIDRTVQMLGGKLKVIPVEGSDYTIYEITFRDGEKEYLGFEDYTFIAWFPQLEILLFEGGHGSDQPFNMNDSGEKVLFSDDNFPYSVKIGNPFYYVVSPDKKWRINGFYDGQDCTLRFLGKWSKSEKKYENIGYFIDYQNMGLCYSGNYFWTDDNTVVFTNLGGTKVEHINEDTEFYEMGIIEGFAQQPSNTADKGTVINDVRWATRNVADLGAFAGKPEDAGMFYQWNRKKAWNATDSIVAGWDNTTSAGDTWEKTNDPSPSG